MNLITCVHNSICNNQHGPTQPPIPPIQRISPNSVVDAPQVNTMKRTFSNISQLDNNDLSVIANRNKKVSSTDDADDGYGQYVDIENGQYVDIENGSKLL